MWPTIFVIIAVVLPGLVLAWALARMAGPANELELRMSDEAQLTCINQYVADRLERTKPN